MIDQRVPVPPLQVVPSCHPGWENVEKMENLKLKTPFINQITQTLNCAAFMGTLKNHTTYTVLPVLLYPE